ncbi:MAG: hypothetical protein ABIO70_15625 [Pseudomonadota bacterium]
MSQTPPIESGGSDPLTFYVTHVSYAGMEPQKVVVRPRVGVERPPTTAEVRDLLLVKLHLAEPDSAGGPARHDQDHTWRLRNHRTGQDIPEDADITRHLRQGDLIEVVDHSSAGRP